MPVFVCAFEVLNGHWILHSVFGLSVLERIQVAQPLSLFWGSGTPPLLLSKKEGFLVVQIHPVYFDLIASGPKREINQIKGAL